jgi:hypothetical protein
MIRWIVLALAGAAVLPAQSSATKVIEVSVWRELALRPEEAFFSVAVGVKLNVSLDEVMQGISSLGITSQDFASVSTNSFWGDEDELSYEFNYQVAFDKLKETLAAFESKRRALGAERGMQLYYRLVGVSPSKASVEAARQRALPELIADARKQAETMASAAGVRVGAVAGLSPSSSIYLGLPRAGVSSGAGLGLNVKFAIE